MNKIDFPRKDVDGKEWSRKDVEKWFCNAFYETIYEKLREINAQDYSREEQKILRFIIEYLESILLASPKRLELITKVMDNINISSNFKKANNKNTFIYQQIRNTTPQNKLLWTISQNFTSLSR